jgi:RNA polymerase sigma-70 factor (ECF subfamily)
MPPDDTTTWLEPLKGDSPDARDDAVVRLYALLLAATRFELSRRSVQLGGLEEGEREELARRAADNALLAILYELDDFQGLSRFTTWASKFALFEAAVAVRRRAWAGRAITAAQEEQPVAPADGGVAAAVTDVLWALTPDERRVYCALALHGVPIDVLAERRGTTRAALYATLTRARGRLRAALGDPAAVRQRGAPPPADDRTRTARERAAAAATSASASAALRLP